MIWAPMAALTILVVGFLIIVWEAAANARRK
jgi:hypothetical protein